MSRLCLLAAVIIPCVALFSGCLDLTSDKSRHVLITANTISPDQQFIATSYGVMGGGAAGWCYAYIGIRKRDEQFDPDRESVFQMSCSQRSNELEITWEGEGQLRVIYPSDADVYKQERLWDRGRSIEIAYESK